MGRLGDDAEFLARFTPWERWGGQLGALLLAAICLQLPMMSILGMTRKEINAKFNKIVEFAGVEEFIDTPVKRYSSGMYVRLAFSVAAHLDPQIMIVDEVLAVGDAAFQKKCLGKMNDVVKQGGRTIIFVSHSMDAIASLCSSVILMNKGRAGEKTTVEEGIKQYLGMVNENGNVPLAERPRTQNKPRPPVFTGLTVINDAGPTNVVACGSRVSFEIQMENLKDPGDLQCAFVLIPDAYRQRLHAPMQQECGVRIERSAQMVERLFDPAD